MKSVMLGVMWMGHQGIRAARQGSEIQHPPTFDDSHGQTDRGMSIGATVLMWYVIII